VQAIAYERYLARVSKRSARVRRAGKQRAQARRQRNNHVTPSQSQQEAVELFGRMIRYVQSSGNPELAAAAARADLRTAAQEVARRACGLDLITVLSSVRVDMIMDRAVTGREPAAALLELVALVLACRDSRGGVVPSATAESEFLPPNVLAAAREALESGSLIALFESPSADAESAILFYSIQREISLRNPVYPHMLLDTLRGLFGDPEVNEDCNTAMGFTGIQAVNVMEALRSRVIKELEDRRLSRVCAARRASKQSEDASQEPAAVQPWCPGDQFRSAGLPRFLPTALEMPSSFTLSGMVRRPHNGHHGRCFIGRY
jgi:hypothetical protein